MACCGWTLIKSMARWNISNIFKHKPAATLLIYTYYHTWQILRSYRILTIQKRWHPNNEEIVFLLDMAMFRAHDHVIPAAQKLVASESPRCGFQTPRRLFGQPTFRGWLGQSKSTGIPWISVEKTGAKRSVSPETPTDGKTMRKPWVSRRFSLVISKKKWREGETGEHF